MLNAVARIHEQFDLNVKGNQGILTFDYVWTSNRTIA